MSRLFFVASSLEPLQIDVKPALSFDELMNLFEMNLPKSLLEDLQKIRMLGDLTNLQAFFYDRKLERTGILHHEEIQDLLNIEEKLPKFITEFLHQYTSIEDRRKFFPFLISEFFHTQMTQNRGYLQELFTFLYHTRLTIAFLRAKKMKRDCKEVFVFEDTKDPFVAFLLAQKESPTTIVDERFNPLKALIESDLSPMEIRRGYYQFMFEEVQKFVQTEPYSKEFIYSYFLSFVLIDRLQKELAGSGQQFMAV